MKPPEAAARTLERLAMRPPQTLLIEGGTEAGRLKAALYWACAVNCPQAKSENGESRVPCLACPVCRQIQANENLDLHIYDGRIANRLDEEKPGPVKALRMENMRELKSMAATAPHGNGKRVVIFQGMSQTREEALNSLLKTLEEPTPHSLFALLAPQREQILQTLVSRSFCLTLPWTDCRDRDEAIAAWENELADFLARGTGFLEHVAAKGAIDAQAASQLLSGCQKALARVLSGQPAGPLDAALSALAESGARAALASRWLGEAQAMLAATVSPARTLEAFGSRMFALLRK
ncbi:MAG: DNA polymerase III subunit delta' [Desulfovibrio sp.]|nr:DNA polymerase III subunit delta' [Desulfovibrio sp.]